MLLPPQKKVIRTHFAKKSFLGEIVFAFCVFEPAILIRSLNVAVRNDLRLGAANSDWPRP